jgi:hypothetical protein
MAREIKVPFKKLRNPQTITSEMEAEFDAQGLNLHVNEVERMEDDEKQQMRVLTVKNTKYFYNK